MLSAEDPLIPVAIDLESYVAQAISEDSTSDVAALMSDYFRALAVRMAGFDTVGTPLVPPDQHVLDHLARTWDLVDTDIAAHRPAADTIACPVETLECDLCGAQARYETHIRVRDDEELVNACLDCTRAHGDPILGAGSSVYLMYMDEVPTAVRQVCDEIRSRQRMESLFATSDDRETGEDQNGRTIDPIAESLRSTILEEINALRIDIDHAAEDFKVDDDGNYEVSRSQDDAYKRLVERAKPLKSALGASSGPADSQDATASPDADRPTSQEASTGPAPAHPSPTPIPLDARAVAVRLRHLWVHTIGPMFDEHGHDLAEVWSSATVRRVGTELAISAPMNFGEGDPLDGELGATIMQMITRESEGVIEAVTYQYADRPVPKLRRAKTSNLDIYHPEDVAAPSLTTVANSLTSDLAGGTATARPVLARLTVAGASKFRLWLAAPTQSDLRAVGSTSGAAADLALAVSRVQRGHPLYDMVVDPEAWRRYPNLALDRR